MLGPDPPTPPGGATFALFKKALLLWVLVWLNHLWQFVTTLGHARLLIVVLLLALKHHSLVPVVVLGNNLLQAQTSGLGHQQRAEQPKEAHDREQADSQLHRMVQQSEAPKFTEQGFNQLPLAGQFARHWKKATNEPPHQKKFFPGR